LHSVKAEGISVLPFLFEGGAPGGE
jgi:hypothetical protein